MKEKGRSLSFAWTSCCILVLLGCQSLPPATPAEEVVWEKHPFTILGSHIEGDTLVSIVQYGGGCGKHDFELLAHGPLMKSLPPKQPLKWVHRSPGDPCRALVTDTIKADLKTHRGTPHGTTVLSLEGWDGTLLYTYR